MPVPSVMGLLRLPTCVVGLRSSCTACWPVYVDPGRWAGVGLRGMLACVGLASKRAPLKHFFVRGRRRPFLPKAALICLISSCSGKRLLVVNVSVQLSYTCWFRANFAIFAVRAMPLLSLTADEQTAAMDAAGADIKYHLAEAGVPEDVQALLFHKGFISLRLFSGLDETRADVRAALATEIGLKHDADSASRLTVARILGAWESSRLQVQAEEKMRVESRLGQMPRIVQLSEHAAMRKAVEIDLGKLRDSEVPAKTVIAAKLEQIEQGTIQAEDLREVLCLEDKDVDLFSGIIEHGTGNLRIRPGKASVALPTCPEDLRKRHRLIAVAWAMCRTKHRNQSWLSSDVIEAFRRFSDHILGKHVAGCPLMVQGVARQPAWKLVLSYEQEVRKHAYQLLRDGDETSLSDALVKACKSPELLNLHFLLPLTTSADHMSSVPSDAPGPWAWYSRDKAGKGKGKGGKDGDKDAVKKHTLKIKTDDGKRICFKFNNGKCKGGCGYEHVCQRCLQPGHGKKACPEKKKGEDDA